MSVKEQLLEVKEKLANLDPNNRDNLVEIARLKTQEIELSKQAAEEEAEQEYKTAVQTAQTEVADIMDNLSINGLPIRSLFNTESDYQLYKIEAQPAFMAQVEKYINDIATYKQQLSVSQAQVEELQQKLQESQQREFQSALELRDMTTKRDAAAAEAEQYKADNEALQKKIDELNAPAPVVSSEEIERKKKELTDKIKRERTIYNRRWVDEIKRNQYRANLAISGEEIEYPWTEAGKYYEIAESEVSQFRSEYQSESAAEAPVVVETPVQSHEDVDQGEQFPVIAPPAIPTVEAGGSQGQQPDQSVAEETTVTRSEFEALKAEVEALKVRVA